MKYDFLIIATGTQTRPDETPGLLGEQWRKSVFDFYTIEGAVFAGNELLYRRISDGRSEAETNRASAEAAGSVKNTVWVSKPTLSVSLLKTQ